MNALKELQNCFQPVLAKYADGTPGHDNDALLKLIRPSKEAKFGDFQANFSMSLGKSVGKNPREVAQEIVAEVDLTAVCDKVEIAGPGFINLTLKESWLKSNLSHAFQDDRIGVEKVANGRNYIVDFSSPNVAKPLHVGHIRSTVIGDALTRILNFMGHHARSDNHIGDWGTQFGMIIYGYRNFRDDAAFENDPIGELSRLYRLVRLLIDFHKCQAQLPKLETEQKTIHDRLKELKQQQSTTEEKAALKKIKKEISQANKKLADVIAQFEKAHSTIQSVSGGGLQQTATEHADIATAVLTETAKLHQGDAENRALWDKFLPVCKQDMQAIYERLNVTFDMELGESFYHELLAETVDDLEAKGFATISDGAMCVFIDEFETPMIIRKKDGAFLYSTTDLATIKYRTDNFQADACLYVVDHRQHEHFEKLFKVASLWGYDQLELKHVSFGTVMGKDGKPFQTRSGDTVGLAGLLDEAERRATEIAKEVNDSISPEQSKENGRVVGIGSLKYADLSQNRASDYTFDYEKMLALKGNTATYLQYGYARVQGIWRKVDTDIDSVRAKPVEFEFETDIERALAVQLLRFEEALMDVLVEYKPNLLCSYLFDLGQIFFKFFEQCNVKNASSDSLKRSRLQFCDLTARTLKTGLELLNIGVLDKM